MKRHFLTLLAVGTLLLTGCVSTSDAGTQNTQAAQATEERSQSSTEAPEAEEAEATMEEESVGDNLASSEQQPSEAIGSTNEVLETSASSLSTLIESLKVAAETPNGYDRGLFKHWIDVDGDGCNTREEVLIAESMKRVTVGSGCSISGGEWLSAFDLVVTTNPSSFDVDHLVPLKEAWDSGASKWDSATRQAFANDLGYEMSLIAVSASSNRSKSDRDPADWLPTNADYKCEYAVAWAQVKSRWSLSIDVKEKRALLGLAGECGNNKLDFNLKAPVAQGTAPAASATPSPTASPSKTASPSATPTPAATQVASTCQPGQVDINIASVEDLMRIKHISTARAPDVVSSRPYTSLDQLTRVKGIAAGRLADIKAEGIACVG
jgi:DNA uptake protein ComE-like DNA-binding protein